MKNADNWQSGIAILEDNVFTMQGLPTESALADRRKDPRFAVRVPLDYRIQSKTQAWRSGETQDISNTGLRLHLDKPAEIGTKVELNVQLPGDSQRMQVEGTIVWVAPPSLDKPLVECGVAFQNLRRITKKDKLLQFITDKLCRLAIKHQPRNMTCSFAQSLSELKKAYSLIYQEYRLREYCPPNPSRLHYSFYCVLPESRTAILTRENEMLGTLSLIVDSPCGLPMESVFPEKIKELRDRGRRVAEVSLLAMDHQAFSKKSFSLTDFQKLTGTFNLFKVIFDYARFVAQVTDFVIAVHPKHEELYRYLNFEVLGSPKLYASANDRPALPMILDIPKTVGEDTENRGVIEFFVNNGTSSDILEKYFEWNRDSLEDLLIRENNLWTGLPADFQAYIKSRYPDFELEI